MYIYHKNQPNAGKYAIHGWYGIVEFISINITAICLWTSMFLVLYPANLAWIHKNGGVLDRGIYYILIYIYIFTIFVSIYSFQIRSFWGIYICEISGGGIKINLPSTSWFSTILNLTTGDVKAADVAHAQRGPEKNHKRHGFMDFCCFWNFRRNFAPVESLAVYICVCCLSRAISYLHMFFKCQSGLNAGFRNHSQ